MPRPRTPIKGKTPAVIDETHPEFQNMVDEYLLIIERDRAHLTNSHPSQLKHPLMDKYGKTPSYQNVIDEAHRIDNLNKEEYNQRVAERPDQPCRKSDGVCTVSGGSRKKRGTRQNKKSHRHKSHRHKIYR